MQEIEEIKNLIADVEGFLGEYEGPLLYRLAKSAKLNIVEIGSYQGLSTIWLGHGIKAGNGKVKIYAIDPHEGELFKDKKTISTFQKFKKNIATAKIDDIVVPIVKTSKDAFRDFKESIDLLFIDGLHDYESVKEDFELWSTKVVEGGVILMHDTIWYPGPRKVANRYLYLSSHYKKVRFTQSISWGIKTKTISLGDRLLNIWFLILKTKYFLVCKFGSVLLPNFLKNIIRTIIWNFFKSK